MDTVKASNETEAFLKTIQDKNPHEPEFLQAVQEVAQDVLPYIEAHARYRQARILERLAEPDRIVIFRVCWIDDQGNYRINRGYRVQMNNALGPYKGGLRFHPSVNLSILKFLAFEQVFKNALTGLPLGGGKGGSDFDPKGKSDNEVMRFCQSFMTELFRHIGPDTDVPAGDIGVGAREVGYLFGQYKRLRNEFSGVLTGKGIEYSGSFIRPEATGYGCVYMLEEMLRTRQEQLKGKKVVISGSGNVAQYAAEKIMQLGGRVVALSDSDGFIHDPDGLDTEKFKYLLWLKNEQRGRIAAYARQFGCGYYPGKKPWAVPCDIAIPCATQNELNGDDARTLTDNGCIAVVEGANMPCTPEAVEWFLQKKILYAPGKASNAGGVAVSGLEMSQNSLRLRWTREEVDERLRSIMRQIHETCLRFGRMEDGSVNYVKGANIGGFVRVADAMLAQGLV
ncbi:MAG: NADP-specific glutamate dehydrogenase [Chitinophagales bacterium]|nr:NADP-specific glutamate dehydrogenase [Chitinophagales bacterium]MDW8427278.1 NADP-specific glutamate dehydrogenase [Chitinophagales bacterium]